MPYKTTIFDWFLLACLVVVWGSSFVMTKIAVASIASEWIVALRIVIGAAVLLLCAMLARQMPDLSLKTWIKYVWLGIIGNTLPFFLITWGLKFIPSGISGLLMGTIPILILLLAHFFLPGERLNRFRILGFVSGFAGLLVIIDPSNLAKLGIAGDALWGELAVVLACFCYAVHSISAKRLGFDRPLAQASGVLIGGAVGAVVLALILAPQGFAEAEPRALWAALGLGLLPTGLATVIMYKLMERTSPTMVAQSNYLVPIYAVIFGAVTLGEKLEWSVLLALSLVLFGIFISRVESKPSSR